MNRNLKLLLLFPLFSFIITRHDVKDEAYLTLGKKFEQYLCHFPMGEGTVIAPLWVVTAGHVGKDIEKDINQGMNISATIGGVNYAIEAVYVHEAFRPIVNDIALVKLAKPAQLSSYPVLYTNQNETGKQIVIAGRGDKGTGLTGPQSWDKKTRAATNKVDGADEHWIWFTFDAPNSPRTTSLEGISGPGDSGGPAFIIEGKQIYLAGISSNQKNEGKKGVYGVTEFYTRISAYSEWIKQIQQNEKPAVAAAKSSSDSLSQYAGNFGFRKIIYKNNHLFFQREDEPLIPMRKIGNDLFLWDDESTKLQFLRNAKGAIDGFEIQRRNGEIVNVKKDAQEISQINYFNQQPPGRKAQMFAPGIISSPLYEHSAPAFSPDGKCVVWALYDGGNYLLESRFENGAWSKPAKPSFADSLHGYVYPSFSADGSKLYFSSDRPVPAGYAQANGNRLWQVSITAKGWDTPIPFDTIASPGNVYANSISNNGALYFSSSTTGGTHWNIYRSEKNGKPKLLPYNINSKDYEDGVYIAPDESFLIFESQRPEGTDGNLSLFISFKNNKGHWSLPVNMGPEINSGQGERFARLSPDGKYLFFGSFRNPAPGSRGADIYWIDAAIIDELRTLPEAQIFIDESLGQQLINSLDKSDVDESIKSLATWRKLHPEHMDAKIIYSSLLRKQKRFREAEQLFTGSLPKWNGNSGVILEIALIKFALNDSAAAKTLLQPVLAQPMDLRKKLMFLSDELFAMAFYSRSDEYFEQANASRPNARAFYNRACAYALVSNKEKAFVLLNKAADNGFNSKTSFEDDKELQSLKSDARWNELLKKLK